MGYGVKQYIQSFSKFVPRQTTQSVLPLGTIVVFHFEQMNRPLYVVANITNEGEFPIAVRMHAGSQTNDLGNPTREFQYDRLGPYAATTVNHDSTTYNLVSIPPRASGKIGFNPLLFTSGTDATLKPDFLLYVQATDGSGNTAFKGKLEVVTFEGDMITMNDVTV